MGYVFVFLTVLFTVAGQLLLKWQIVQYGSLPGGITGNTLFLMKLFLNPWILAGFFSAFLAALFWMAAMTKLELGVAYPFMSLAFIFVLAFSIMFLGESLSWVKVFGTAFVILGLVLVTR